MSDNDESIEISPHKTLFVGGTWQKTLPFTPATNVVSVTHQLMAKDSTSDVASTYITGNPSGASTPQVTTGQVGKNGATEILPGSYTYFLFVTTSSGVKVLYQELEFLPLKGI